MRRCLLTGLFILCSHLNPAQVAGQQQSLSLSTYFTAPFGAYQQARLFPAGSEAGVCNVNNNGLMYILNNGTPGQLRYCWGGAGRAVATTWIQTGNNLYPADSANAALRVGIGTGVNPVMQRLQVVDAGPIITRFEGSGAPARIEFAQANAAQGYVGADTINAFVVQNSGGAQQFAVTQNGSVGIKTNPGVSIFEILGNGVGQQRARMSVRSVDNEAGISFLSNEDGEFTIYSPAASDELRFQSGGTDFMRLSAGPNSTVGIGTAPTANKLEVVASAGQRAFQFMTSGLSETFYMDENGEVFLQSLPLEVPPSDPANIYSDGYFYNPSDISLKKNIKPAPGLAAIMKMEGISFDWKKNDQPDMGVSAQNIEKIFPTLVQENPNTHEKHVRYNSLIAPLIQAIKEQQQEIAILKKKIEYLKSRN